MNYVVENYRTGGFYNEAKGPREFVPRNEATVYNTKPEAMHIVLKIRLSNPALDLCVLQVASAVQSRFCPIFTIEHGTKE